MKALLLMALVSTGVLADTAAQIEEEILQGLLRAEAEFDPEPGRRAFMASHTGIPALEVSQAPIQVASSHTAWVGSVVRAPQSTHLLDAMAYGRLQGASTPEQVVSAQQTNLLAYNLAGASAPRPTYLLDAMAMERLQRAETPAQTLSAQRVNRMSYELFGR